VMTRPEVLGFQMLPGQRSWSERMLELFTELPIDDLVIDTAISLRSTLKIKAMDALIASTALNHNLPLITTTAAISRPSPASPRSAPSSPARADPLPWPSPTATVSARLSISSAMVCCPTSADSLSPLLWPGPRQPAGPR